MSDTSRIVRFSFPVWNLWVQREFSFDGHCFSPVEGYEDVVFRLLNEENDELTVTVTYDDDGSRKASPALTEHGRPLDDYLLLLSLAQGRHVHYRVAYWEERLGDRVTASGSTPAQGRVMPARGERALTPWETEPFLAAAKETLQQPGWAERSGFREALTWYLESISTHLPGQRFLQAWQGLETLALGFVAEEGWSTDSGQSGADVALAMHEMSRQRGWGWITPSLCEMWAAMSRDLAGHPREGRLFGPRYVYEFAGKLQLSLLLALLHMVGMHEFARRDRIQRMIARRLAGW